MATQLVTNDPGFVGAWLLLAQAATAGREWDLAFNAIERVLLTDPRHADAYFIRGMMHEERGSTEQAIADFGQVLTLESSHTAALDRKGALHDSRGEFMESLACADRLIEIDQTNADAQHKRGITLRELGRLADAEDALRTATALDPDSLDTGSHLALVLVDQGRFEEAEALLCSILDRQPDHAEGRWTRAVLHLLQGRFGSAWDDHEWRESKRDSLHRVEGIPEWDGTRIGDGCLLVFSEQGLGDQIMFASCVEDALRLCPTCVIECDSRLTRLFQRSFPQTTVVPADTKPLSGRPQGMARITAQVPIGSLPKLFRRRMSDFPVRDSYLVADPDKVASWCKRLEALGPGPKIGLSWTGGAVKTRRHLRSMSLETLLPVLQARRDCHFFSLQYVKSTAEVQSMLRRHGIAVHEFHEIHGSYDETAAFVRSLDLVISVCTSAIHLAGALGVRVWIMAPAAPEWRYLACGNEMPWYRTARIWRQTVLGDWDPTIQAIASELASFCGSRSGDSARPKWEL